MEGYRSGAKLVPRLRNERREVGDACSRVLEGTDRFVSCRIGSGQTVEVGL